MSSESDTKVNIKRERRSPSLPAARGRKSQQNRSLNGSVLNQSLTNDDLLRDGGFLHGHSIEEYLATKTSVQMIDPTKNASALCPSILLDEDEEVWLMQCPRNIDVAQLVGTKLQLNGERHKIRSKGKLSLEYSSEILDRERYCSVLCKSINRRPTNKMVSVQPAGLVRLQEKLAEPVVLDIERQPEVLVPYPANLKIRHPLHGLNFVEKTELPSSIKRKLRNAVKASNVAKAERIVYIKEETEESQHENDFKMEENFDEMMGIKAESETPRKKAKKRKATQEDETLNGTYETDQPKKAKRSKKVKVEDSETNLDWLAAI